MHSLATPGHAQIIAQVIALFFKHYASYSPQDNFMTSCERNTDTAVCNGVVSHGAQIGGLQVFADHTHKNKCKTNASMIFACHMRPFTHVYLHAQTAVDAGDIRT